MNTSYSIIAEAARERQRDMMAAAERDRRGRQARDRVRAAQPRAARRSGRTWQLVQQLRTQTQS